MVSCEECGKVTGVGDVGSHWICGDCRVSGKHHGEADREKLPLYNRANTGRKPK